MQRGRTTINPAWRIKNHEENHRPSNDQRAKHQHHFASRCEITRFINSEITIFYPGIAACGKSDCSTHTSERQQHYLCFSVVCSREKFGLNYDSIRN